MLKFVVDVCRNEEKELFHKLATFALLLFASAFGFGNTINAASCSSANVLSAIASASNGDTVVVPSGTCTWTTPSANTPTITLTKSITLQGQTTCSGSPITCTDHTIINDGTGNGFDENLIDDNANNSRITGFSFKDPRNLSDAKYPVQLTCTGCRFDHNSVTQANAAGATHGIYVFSSVSGGQLADHNYFLNLNGAVDVDGSGSDAHFPGDQSWSTTLVPGSGNAAYIENNNFVCDYSAVACPLDGAYDSYAGARLVFRFNTLTNYNIGGHGLDSGGLRSTLLQEVYNNTSSTPGSHIYTWMGTRGGTHMIFTNTVNAGGGSYDSFLWLQEYRASSGYSWGSPVGALCGGSPTNNIDGNTSHGWPCRDQVGRGPETAPATDWPINTVSPAFSEASFPGYAWNNNFKGSAPTTANINVCDAVPNCSTSNATLYQILNNRDFYMEAASFNGTSGTGTGTLASRPATCTTGVAYWATDQGSWNQSGSGGQGVLYVCASTNTWSLYYTPYTYPNPLQGVAPTIPSGSAVLFGNVRMTGSSRIGSSPSGGPLAYAARTDNSVNCTGTGTPQSDCIAGATTGQTGSAMSFLDRTTDTVPAGFGATTITFGSCPSGLTPSGYPAYCPAPMNSTATDPDFNSYEVMASDDNLHNGTTWTEGEGANVFSSDETLMLMISASGTATVVNINPASIHAKTCATSPCVNSTGLFSAGSGNGDATHLASGSDKSFSLLPSEPHVLFERNDLLVNKTVINSSIASPGTGTVSRTAYVDFTSDTPVPCSVFPPITVGANTSNFRMGWGGVFHPADDDSIGYALGGGYDWLPSWTPADGVGNSLFIFPSTNNTGNKGFQATAISGNTGLTEPNWDASCPTLGNTCTSGGVTWTNIGNVKVQGPGFDIVSYKVGLGCSRLSTRLAKIYRGTANPAPSGPVTTTDPVASTRATGAPGSTVNLPDEFTLHGSQQFRNSNYLAMTPTGSGALLPPGSWNSGTLTCQPNGSSDVWAGAWNSGTTYTSKKTVSYTDGTSAYYVATTATGNLNKIPRTGGVVNTTYWTQSEGYCTQYFWNIPTTLVQPLTAWGQTGGHTAFGYLNTYFGSRYIAGSIASPSFQASPPNGPITLNPGTNMLPTAFPSDDHSTYWNGGIGDLQPPVSALFDVPVWPTNYTAACYGEVCGVANVATGAAAKTYRFAHIDNTGNNQFFAVQQNIGVVSPKGDLYAVPSDMMGTRGTVGASSVQCTGLRGQFSPVGGMTLNINDTVYPMANNAGNHIYKTTVGGLTSGTLPTWCQTSSCTLTWGAATLQEIGINDCRGDVKIIDLLSAHPAP